MRTIFESARGMHSGRNCIRVEEVLSLSSKCSSRSQLACQRRAPHGRQGGSEVAILWSSNVLDGIASLSEHTPSRSHPRAFGGRSLGYRDSRISGNTHAMVCSSCPRAGNRCFVEHERASFSLFCWPSTSDLQPCCRRSGGQALSFERRN
jgi:hypothetical protein